MQPDAAARAHACTGCTTGHPAIKSILLPPPCCFACTRTCCCRLVTGEPIEAFCSRVVEGCGVLLLPASVYDHAPCIERGHFRIGLGRRDLPECLGKLAEWLRAPKAAPA